MGWLSQIFGGKGDEGAPEPPSMPWDRRPSILEHIQAHIIADGPGLADGGEKLPDEEPIAQGSKIRWAPGALDGVATHHMGVSENEEIVRRTLDLVLAYSRQPTASNKADVYEQIIAEQVVSIIDPVIEALLDEPEIDHGRLYELARSFATESPDRESVKFGIAILGLFRQAGDLEIFLTLGRHDEFTLFSAVAISNLSESHKALWTLARNVDGWGRIHAVERLAETDDPEIKRWLLREGFRNSILDEYLAVTCARAGGLLAALSEDQVDRELLTSAGDLLRAMIPGGPAESIDDFEDARPVVESYLDHMATQAETVEDFLRVHAIQGFLDEDDSQWTNRYEAGWTAEVRDRLKSACGAILDRPDWEGRVLAGLESEDDLEFFDADQAAKALGIDTWEVHWRRLRERPAEPGRWYPIMSRCDDASIGMVIEFAEVSLDLAAIATGASDEFGLGPGFEPHSCLDYILQELRCFPGYGTALIEAGLKSPVVRNRGLAIRVLAAWGPERWSAGLTRSLEQAADCEPDDDMRERMRKVLRGEPLSP